MFYNIATHTHAYAYKFIYVYTNTYVGICLYQVVSFAISLNHTYDYIQSFFIVQHARHLLKFFIHAHCEHRHMYVYMYVRESYDNCVVRRIVAKC